MVFDGSITNLSQPSACSISGLKRGRDLSIVVQGGLSRSNIIEAAGNLRHWRILFPEAEIVLSISTCDDLLPIPSSADPIHRLSLVNEQPSERNLALGLEDIVRFSNRLVISAGATPLPPIKLDENFANNANLQIAAAKTGLAAATRSYTLRVRNDLRMETSDFIDFYMNRIHVGSRVHAIFLQRILISQLFTLNPFGPERLPFHFSDWFNFGLTNDLRNLWDVEAMCLQDAIFYSVHPHAAHSNASERRFRTRFAVEQWITKTSFARSDRTEEVRFHNDMDLSEISMRHLIDNFVVADLKSCSVHLPKQQHLFDNPDMKKLCVTPDDWLVLASASSPITFSRYYNDCQK